jgi:hypothetical protein
MISICYWQNMTKRFAIKVALPHLLLGLLATTFSLFDQTTYIGSVPETNISTIAAVIVNFQQYRSANQVDTPFPISIKYYLNRLNFKLPSFTQDKHTVKVIRLTPSNGIRAGPGLF